MFKETNATIIFPSSTISSALSCVQMVGRGEPSGYPLRCRVRGLQAQRIQTGLQLIIRIRRYANCSIPDLATQQQRQIALRWNNESEFSLF